MLTQLDRSGRFLAQAGQSISEALDCAQSAHQSVMQAQIGLTMQEIEYAQNRVHEALLRIYQAQQFVSPENERLSAQLQIEHDRLLQEYQLFK
jgi:ureidoglycolate hydrolase